MRIRSDSGHEACMSDVVLCPDDSPRNLTQAHSLVVDHLKKYDAGKDYGGGYHVPF